MNIAIIACVAAYAGVFAYMLRKDDSSKTISYVLIALVVIFEILFAIFHPILWIAQVLALVLAVSYYHICDRTSSSIVFPYLIFMYSFLLTASGAIILVIIEAIFGKFF